MPDTSVCVCGHDREAHEHFRRGTECSICGAALCPRFRVRRFWHRRPTA